MKFKTPHYALYLRKGMYIVSPNMLPKPKKSMALCIFVDAPSNRMRECPQIIPTLTLLYTPLTPTALVEASSQLLAPSAL